MKTSKHYIKEIARALVVKAIEEGVLETVLADLENISAALSTARGIAPVLQNRSLEPAKRRKMLSDALKNHAHKFTINALLLLQEKNLLRFTASLLAASIKAAEGLADYKEARIISAVELSDPERHQLMDSLTKKFGKSLKLRETVDKGILGGLILEVGSKRFDFSAKGWINGLRNAIINAV